MKIRMEGTETESDAVLRELPSIVEVRGPLLPEPRLADGRPPVRRRSRPDPRAAAFGVAIFPITGRKHCSTTCNNASLHVKAQADEKGPNHR